MESLLTLSQSKPYGIIYRIRNKVNHKIYIGKTSLTLDERMTQHRREHKGSKRIRYLYNAMKKYGLEHFESEIMMYLYSKKELDQAEVYCINDIYHSRNSSIGYNIAKGGDGGDTLSTHPNKEDIYKRSAIGNSLTRANWSEEKKKEVGDALSKREKGVKKSPEAVLKNTNTQRAIWKDTTFDEYFGERAEELRKCKSHPGKRNPFFGKIHSKEILNIITQKNIDYQEKLFLEKLESYKDKIVILYTKKYSIKKIAKEMCISYTLVTRILKRLKFPIGKKERNFKEISEETIIKLYTVDKLNIYKISLQLNVSHRYIKSRLANKGLL